MIRIFLQKIRSLRLAGVSFSRLQVPVSPFWGRRRRQGAPLRRWEGRSVERVIWAVVGSRGCCHSIGELRQECCERRSARSPQKSNSFPLLTYGAARGPLAIAARNSPTKPHRSKTYAGECVPLSLLSAPQVVWHSLSTAGSTLNPGPRVEPGGNLSLTVRHGGTVIEEPSHLKAGNRLVPPRRIYACLGSASKVVGDGTH